MITDVSIDTELGCYWGTEKFFKTDFGAKIQPGSIVSGKVGFMVCTH